MKELGFITQHEIRIKPTCNRGFVITIGCATIAAGYKEELIQILDVYLDDPKGWTKKYNSLEGAPCTEPDVPAPVRDEPETATDSG